ncbi:MAG: bacteriohemerythrin [Terracidiphilus sp.]
MTYADSSTTPALSAPLPERPRRPFRDEDLMIWSEKIGVGIGVIDTEHQDLFDAINDLHVAVIGHEDRASVSSLLIRVVEGTRAHFTSEESLMERVKYNGKTLHALKHQYLLDQIDAFDARYRRGVDLNEHSLIFIRDWFIPHILEVDKNFGLWYSEHCLR